MIKIQAIILDEESSWSETFEITENEDPVQVVEEIINRFNTSLRKGEKPRKLLFVRTKFPENDNKQQHQWEKSCLVTKFEYGRAFDTYRCVNCNITGKRFGLSPTIVPDKKYQGLKYKFCKGTK